MPRPTNLEMLPDGRLAITWDDGKRRAYRVGELRDKCPCATCREKRTEPTPSTKSSPMMLPVLSAAEAQPLKLLGMTPVGNYAYAVAFSDGHDTGIFTFELLRELGEAH